jgi:hypothetical protein
VSNKLYMILENIWGGCHLKKSIKKI